MSRVSNSLIQKFGVRLQRLTQEAGNNECISANIQRMRSTRSSVVKADAEVSHSAAVTETHESNEKW